MATEISIYHWQDKTIKHICVLKKETVVKRGMHWSFQQNVWKVCRYDLLFALEFQITLWGTWPANHLRVICEESHCNKLYTAGAYNERNNRLLTTVSIDYVYMFLPCRMRISSVFAEAHFPATLMGKKPLTHLMQGRAPCSNWKNNQQPLINFSLACIWYSLQLDNIPNGNKSWR